MSPPPPPPLLTLDNFTSESEVPENCPFVLTSPRSLEACRRAGVQPVSLLPTTLQEYEEALPDLPRDKVLQIFREVETAKEGKLGLCREIRTQLIWEAEGGPAPGRGLRRKLSCLSPIVEVTSGTPVIEVSSSDVNTGGRDSALGESNSGTVSGSQETDSPDLENSQEIQASVRSLRSFTLSPGPVLLSSQDQSDKPESDQHFNFPLIRVQPPEDDKELSGQLRTSGCHEALSRSNSPSATGLSGLSHTSLESDAFYSDLVFSCDSQTPSPAPQALGGTRDRGRHQTDSDWRSCPELDKDSSGHTSIVTGFSDTHQFPQISKLGFPNTMEKTSISRSAHTIKVSDRPSDLDLSPTYRRTPTRTKKKKASRSSRLTCDSLQSLYDGSCDNLREDECPESERSLEVRTVKPQKSSGCGDCSGEAGSGRSAWPWSHKPRPWVSPGNSNLVRSALSRSDIDIDQLQISQQDLRLLEILTIRNNAEQERKQHQHKLRIQWEEERCQREAAKTELEKEYRKQVSAKRRKESSNCARRLEAARDRLIRSQEHLRSLLKEKDDRKKVLIDTIAKQKEALLREHRECEESRRLAVDNAVKDLLARDTLYRNELKVQLEEKIKNAEKRKKLYDNQKLVSVAESRRIEVEEHQLRMKHLEELYDDHIEKIKRSIEKKIKQSQDLLNRKSENQKSISDKNSEYYSRTLALKAELEGKLDLWRKQVLSVQSLSIRRAEEKVRNEIDNRREKLAEEMRSREVKCLENRREKEQAKRQKLKITKKKIEEKDRKVEKLLSEREQSIIRARKMAETSAKLREIIKSFQ